MSLGMISPDNSTPGPRCLSPASSSLAQAPAVRQSKDPIAAPHAPVRMFIVASLDLLVVPLLPHQSPDFAAALFLSFTDCSISVATPRGSSCCATCPPGNVRMVQPRDTARCQLLSVLARSSADLSF